MTEAQANPQFGYRKLSIEPRCGPTPAFAWAGSRASGECGMPREQWPAWWQAALDVLGQLESFQPQLGGWLKRAQSAPTAIEGFDPLAAGWQALLASLNLPDYPMQADGQADGTVVWHTACPYGDFVRLGLPLTSTWLDWSFEAWRLGRLQIDGRELRMWRRIFGRLSRSSPPAQVIALHERLRQGGITWQWLGSERTRIGQGASQRIVEGGGERLDLSEPDAWRVPIYTVTGSVGKTTTVRLLSQLLQGSGKRLAVTASDGAWIGGKRVAKGDCIGGKAARALLQDPRVEAALIEQGLGGITQQGVPYARSDVAVLLNAQAVHLGLYGIGTVEDVADAKALGLNPARIAVLNHDDGECKRIGAKRDARSCGWFSVTAAPEILRGLSARHLAAAGVERGGDGEPQALVIWRAGQVEHRFSLRGVAPYQGLLGEKTLEELLAAVMAAWFGPLPIDNWDARLPALRLDSENHLFRTSVHRQGPVVYVLDKAGQVASLAILRSALEEIARLEGARHRIAVVARSAVEHPETHMESAGILHRFMDEFVCFDRPEAYAHPAALPIYGPGSIPRLLRDEFLRLNAERGTDKPVTVVPEWSAAEAYLSNRLAELDGKTLVLINQPATSAQELNQRIARFVSAEPSAIA